MSERVSEPLESSSFAPRCVSIDLEVGVRNARIRRFAAVRSDTGQSFVFHKGDLAAALDRLDDFADGAAFLLGHNLIGFDAAHLAAAKPDLRLLKLPMVDTLRLNPLAFPRNPYHHLVKHYQDGQLKRGRLNDPELDARLALDVFRDQYRALQALQDTAPDLLLAWHWLTTADNTVSGLNAFFSTVRRKLRPSDAEAYAATEKRLSGHGCLTHGREIRGEAERYGWALAYALAWLSVSGGNSVMPPWVRHQFPEAGMLVRRLRDTPCNDAACVWCRERHDARKELARWFGFSDFRPEPEWKDGRSMQQAIVEAAMHGDHVLGILPTGSGKSLCYQIPALSRYDKTGALTVVISPLVALMADQVEGLEKRGISCCKAINGLLSMPERADVLDRVRLGDIGILIVSPEQLRNRSVRRVLAQREIGGWVLDEAHCISKWGHDFRPDYRYVARFIKEKAGGGPLPPLLCLTATAKPDVVADMLGHFRERLDIELKVFPGGAHRTNLDFAVVPTSPAEKLAHIHQVLLANLPPEVPGGAIVYCATRKQTEEVAQFLHAKELAADYFHAGLPPETKKHVQQRFIQGELRAIVATNAFGMGIDKPDVRLVIHADIPGSLENYLQEAGRAGRDQAAARCVLLYTPDDVERQFGMSARSRLTQREIQAILWSLRNLDRKKRRGGEVIATSGEILAEEDTGAFERDSATDDTRVRTSIAWLEEAHLLSREENQVQVFPSSLRVSSVDEAREKVAKVPMVETYRRQLLSIVEALIAANPDEGISTDELMGVSALNAEQVRKALYDLEHLGIASNDTALTVFVHAGVERSSLKRFEEAVALEAALIDELRLAAPELDKGEHSFLHLRHFTQRLKDAGHSHALPEKVWRLVRSLAADGRNEDGGAGSLGLRRLDTETVQVTLHREWAALAKTAQLRRAGAGRLLEHLLACLPQGSKGTDLLAETTLGKLVAALQGDIVIKSEAKDVSRLLDRALLWLHEQEVIRLNKGLAVFRPAMTIRLAEGRQGFAKAYFAPLKLHYDEQVVQIHVMAEYAQRGRQAMADAVRLAMDYFTLQRDAFIRKWLPQRNEELSRQTTPASWRAIVESLNNRVQQKIVADDRELTNVLVLAGPGSGKTRVLVHRIAYLVRVQREIPRGILALAYNRHAAVEIRRRLADLIGDDARGVTVLTCHALAMRLTGASFLGRAEKVENDAFKEILQHAVALLKGADLPPEEADEQRERLLAGFRWILVDEYQDIGPDQYELISALAGRTLQDEDRKLSLFAVGDDDQNVYAFDGASVEFIRRFESDYAAKPAFLTENYRSTEHIITAANLVIAPARNRMKAGHPIVIDRARSRALTGGEWEKIDPVGKGRVQILPAGKDAMMQAVAVMTELQRIAVLAPDWNWTSAAVIAREWKYLEPVRSFCEIHGIPVQMADEEAPNFWRLRETRTLVEWLRGREIKLVDTGAILRWLDQQHTGAWWGLLREAVEAYALETSGAELPGGHFIEWLAEWGREVRRRQTGLMLLTGHRAKGLEFDHVAVLDGGWEKVGKNEDRDAPRRLYYVAMTRARKTLTLSRFDGRHALLDALAESRSVLHRAPTSLPAAAPELARHYQRLTPGDVDLGFVGRRQPGDKVHQAISALTAGDALKLRRDGESWQLLDNAGVVVGRLARAYTPPAAGMECIAAHVAAIIVRRREDEQPDFRERIRCDRWEVVVPDLLFAPKR
ncbi:MAG: RecQ family ATP-dependent DNA helicase [Betaproteobacteria bacterium]|nr:RecQ family ATP-dependent DNA helicase [Betaproteobacteria bacterium]